MIGLAVVVGFIVIFQAMYTAVLERTREIGILKSLGASQTYIVNLVVTGIYHLDDEERAALARNGEDMRLGRFASDRDVERTFRRA